MIVNENKEGRLVKIERSELSMGVYLILWRTSDSRWSNDQSIGIDEKKWLFCDDNSKSNTIYL